MLIDSNIVFSLLLKQNDYKTTEKLFDLIESFNLQVFISDFAIYSISLIFSRRNELKVITEFFNNLKNSKNFHIYRYKPEEILECLKLNVQLDFDDCLHYFLAKKKNLQLISFDSDFDKTDLKRLTPLQVLNNPEFF